MLRPTTRNTKRILAQAFVIGVGGIFAPASAQAHFVLQTPEAWMSQDDLGGPEKLGPCGDEGGGTPTGKVTVFHPGQTITVKVNEVVYHPGHYRVALATSDRSQLPPEPIVTPAGGDQCASAVIEDPPTFPILADNVLPHTAEFADPQSFQVTLPANVTCTKCTLQVMEFMSNHSAPCFYHHCADISIVPDDAGSGSSAADGAAGSSGAAATSQESGCSCRAGARGTSGVASFTTLLVFAARMRRRRSRRCASKRN